MIHRCLALLVLTASALHAAPGGAGDAGPNSNGPILFFQAADLPALQQKILTPDYAPLWKTVLEKVQHDCDPQSPDYADPGIYLKPMTTGPLAGAGYARKLNEWMEEIGFAYQITGNAGYGQHGAALLEAAARNLTFDSKAMESPYPGTYGDMMRALATGLDFLSDALTPEQRAVITACARNYILRHAKDYNVPHGPWQTTLLPHNFDGVCGGALGILAIALRNDYPDQVPGWIQMGEKMCTDWFGAGFDRAGAYFEGVLYMQYGLGNALLFGDALQRYQHDATVITNPTIQKVPAFLAMEKLPGESAFDARNDSLYSVELGPYLLLMASGYRGAIPGDPLAAWLWKNTSPKKRNPVLQIVWGNHAPDQNPAQVLPAPYGAYYADRGLCVWRTGWNRSDVTFSIEAGPFHPITHNKADKGHFNLCGLGYRWAVDPGYGNNREPAGRAQTVAHSCVLVDGKGQALSGAGLGTDGKVLKEENNARYGYALIDAKSAYNKNSAGTAGVPLTKALRHAFFLRPAGGVPAYAVVLDDIEEAGKTHQFSWQMLTWRQLAIQVAGPDSFLLKTGAAPASNDPTMKVILNASAPLTLSSDVYVADDHPGRPPNDYQRLHAAATAANPRFVAVLAPLPAGTPEPVLTVEQKDDGRLIKINWGTRTDTISWNGDEAKLLD